MANFSLLDKPHQPRSFAFPCRVFGKRNPVKRAFRSDWFTKWKWLHYDESLDAVFCFHCRKAEMEGKLRSTTKDLSFISKGYVNWKDATEAFKRHEASKCHQDANQVMIVLPATTRDIGESCSAAHAQQKLENRSMMLKILQSIRFLGRQGIALRGHDDSESNFMQLMKLRACDDSKVMDWLQKKSNKYTSPEIQNEILQIMALDILRSIAADLHKASFFTIMADESTDSANKEELVLCFRWVDDHLEVHEEFIGLYQLSNTTANTIVAVIKDTLVRMNLNLNRCRGQCYDGAGAMAGAHKGVASQISTEEPRALFTHCYGHALNLAACDAVKKCKVVQDAMDATFEISKLIKYSPKRDAVFTNLKTELSPDTPGFRVLCPTRWTVRADSLLSVMDNYTVLQHTWEECLETRLDTEVKSRVIGVKAQMESFNFFFGVCLGECVLRHADNLSKTLQSVSISAAGGQQVAALTLKTLEGIRTAERFDLFWKLVLLKSSKLDLSEPELPRKRKAPKRFEVGSGESHFPTTVEEHYRRYYFEVLDLAINSIKQRFDQPGYRMYQHLESLLLMSTNGESFDEDLRAITQFYGADIEGSMLKVQLETLATHFKDESQVNLQDIVAYFKQLSLSERQIYSEVLIILHLILVNPSTNSVSERSFSAMRRLKTYLRSTMTQQRLNHIMVLHIHKDKTDKLSMTDIGNNSEHRLSYFGKFD